MQVLGEILQEMSLGVVVQGDEELLRRLSTVAKEAGELLATMIKEASSPLPDHVYQVRASRRALLYFWIWVARVLHLHLDLTRESLVSFTGAHPRERDLH
jgi:hypothetical protein